MRVYNLHELFFQICNEVDPTILSNFREAAEIKLSSEDFLFSIGGAFLDSSTTVESRFYDVVCQYQKVH